MLGFRLQSCKGCVAVLYRARRTIDGTTRFMTRFLRYVSLPRLTMELQEGAIKIAVLSRSVIYVSRLVCGTV